MATEQAKQATQQAIKETQPDLGDFFAPSQAKIQTVKALGFDYWDMDNGSICKIYEASRMPDSEKNRFGIIPVTHAVEPGLIPRLKEIRSWPCVLDVEILTIAGAKNKSTTKIIGISAAGA